MAVVEWRVTWLRGPADVPDSSSGAAEVASVSSGRWEPEVNMGW